jgi:hypothetical protein
LRTRERTADLAINVGWDVGAELVCERPQQKGHPIRDGTKTVGLAAEKPLLLRLSAGLEDHLRSR